MKLSIGYTESQIIKHALQHYVSRPYANPNDLKNEEKVLRKLENFIEEMKKEYAIGASN